MTLHYIWQLVKDWEVGKCLLEGPDFQGCACARVCEGLGLEVGRLEVLTQQLWVLSEVYLHHILISSTLQLPPFNLSLVLLMGLRALQSVLLWVPSGSLWLPGPRGGLLYFADGPRTIEAAFLPSWFPSLAF